MIHLRRALTLLAGFCLVAAVPSPPALAAKPAPTQPPLESWQRPSSIDLGKTPGALASLSVPRVLHVGDRLKLTYGSTSPDTTWKMGGAGLAMSGDCPASGGVGQHVCTLTYPKTKVLSGPMWDTVEVPFTYTPSCFPGGCFRTSMFREPVLLIPDDRSVLSGSVRDRNNAMVPGVRVQLRGEGHTYQTTTGGDGTFAALLPTGTWTVTPDGTWDPASRKVTLKKRGAQAHFKAPVNILEFDVQESHLVNGLDWTTATASGLNWRSATLRAHTGSGTPVTDAVAVIDAPYLDGEYQRSPNVICDGSWRPLFASSDQAERITDSAGTIPATVLFGNQISTSQWHAHMQSAVPAWYVDILGATGPAAGPVADTNPTPMQNAKRLGLPVPPLFAADQGALQTGLAEWWLAYRAGENAGPQSLPATGDFVPVRNAANSAGALVFHPAGNPAPLREHLRSGTPLPDGYATLVLGFQQSLVNLSDGSVMSWTVRLPGLPTLSAWEAEHGPAVDGFLTTGSGLGAGWLGGPIPPLVTDRAARAQYARCVPGATPPGTVVEVHSPVSLGLPENSGAFQIARGRTTGTVFVLPGASSVTLKGSGKGEVELLVRRATSANLFTFTARPKATGRLTLGRTATVTFAGRKVAGRTPGIRVVAKPATVKAGKKGRVTVRVRDVFGGAVRGAQVTIRGAGVKRAGTTAAKGTVGLAVKPSKRGVLVVRAASPGVKAAPVKVRVR